MSIPDGFSSPDEAVFESFFSPEEVHRTFQGIKDKCIGFVSGLGSLGEFHQRYQRLKEKYLGDGGTTFQEDEEQPSVQVLETVPDGFDSLDELHQRFQRLKEKDLESSVHDGFRSLNEIQLKFQQLKEKEPEDGELTYQEPEPEPERYLYDGIQRLGAKCLGYVSAGIGSVDEFHKRFQRIKDKYLGGIPLEEEEPNSSSQRVLETVPDGFDSLDELQQRYQRMKDLEAASGNFEELLQRFQRLKDQDLEESVSRGSHEVTHEELQQSFQRLKDKDLKNESKLKGKVANKSRQASLNTSRQASLNTSRQASLNTSRQASLNTSRQAFRQESRFQHKRPWY